MLDKLPEISQKIIGELMASSMSCGSGVSSDIYKY